MTQNNSSLYKRVNIPQHERFNPDRPSLEAACCGNRTMGSVLNYFLFKASYEADRLYPNEQCKGVTVEISRDDILQVNRISEKTLIGYLSEFNRLGYVKRGPYQRTYEVSFEAINKAIAEPPKRHARGRPKGTHKSCSNSSQENTSTLPEISSTYVTELEQKVEVFSSKLKTLEEKFTELQLSQKVLQQKFTELQLSQSHEPAREVAQESISEGGNLINNNNPIDTSSETEQTTDALDVTPLSLRDESETLSQSSYSQEPAESEWLSENKGEVDIFSEDADPTEKRPTISKQQGGNLAPGVESVPLESEERREGSGQMPVVKPPSPGRPPASPGRAAPLPEHDTLQSTRDQPTRQPTEKPTGDDPPSDISLPSTQETDGKGNRKKNAPLLCETAKIRTLIDANRGYALEEKGAIIHQSTVIKEWCGRHPLEHYHLVITYLSKKDPFWSKEGRVHRFFNADKLASETPRVLAELGLTPKPEPPPDIPVAAMPQINGKYHHFTRDMMFDPIELGV
jgi:hypothetical protein